MLSRVKDVLEGRYTPAQPLTRAQRAAGIVLFVLLMAGGAIGAVNMARDIWPEGPHAAARAELLSLADALREADRTGDARAALSLFERGSETFAAVNANAEKAHDTASRACQLAMAHLVAGVEMVSRGGRWYSQDRFGAALEDCR